MSPWSGWAGEGTAFCAWAEGALPGQTAGSLSQTPGLPVSWERAKAWEQHNRVQEPDLGIRRLTNCVTSCRWALSLTGNVALEIKWALRFWKGQAATPAASGNHAARRNQLSCCLKQKLRETCMLKKRQKEVLKSQKCICLLWKQDEFIKGIWLQKSVHFTIHLLYPYVTLFGQSYADFSVHWQNKVASYDGNA